MIDPINAWNTEMFPSCKYLFNLYGEIADACNKETLDTCPISKQWMEVPCERILETIKEVIGETPVNKLDDENREFAIGYGIFNPSRYIDGNPRRCLLLITPCDIDMLSHHIRMGPYELYVLQELTNILGLKDPAVMRDYRIKLHNTSTYHGMQVMHSAMLAAKI